MKSKKPSQGLWTWDFTIITAGSVISLIGGVLSGFGMSIMVLDYTGSVFLYALFNASYQIPMLVCPVLAGPYLDRMSRKKAIYRLDFLSAGLFALLFLLLRSGWFSFPALLAFSLIRGSIDSVYRIVPARPGDGGGLLPGRTAGGDLLQHPHCRHPVLPPRRQAGQIQRGVPDDHLAGLTVRHPSGGLSGGSPARAGSDTAVQRRRAGRRVAVHVPEAAGGGGHL